MKNKKLANIFNGMITCFREQLKDMGQPDLNVQTFDIYSSGLITGYSLKKEGFGIEEVKETMNELIKMSNAEELGVTGTAEERFDTMEACEYCGGINGEHEDITTMEQVYAGEPHMAPIGSQTCPNALPDNEDDHE